MSYELPCGCIFASLIAFDFASLVEISNNREKNFYLFYGFIPSPGKCYLVRFFLQSWGLIGEGSVHNPLRCFLAVSWAFLYAGVLSYWM